MMLTFSFYKLKNNLHGQSIYVLRYFFSRLWIQSIKLNNIFSRHNRIIINYYLLNITLQRTSWFVIHSGNNIKIFTSRIIYFSFAVFIKLKNFTASLTSKTIHDSHTLMIFDTAWCFIYEWYKKYLIVRCL